MRVVVPDVCLGELVEVVAEKRLEVDFEHLLKEVRKGKLSVVHVGDRSLRLYSSLVPKIMKADKLLEHLSESGRPSLNQFDRPEMLDHVKMFDHPERVEGMYHFNLDKASQREVEDLLDKASERGDKQYGIMKAEISERFVPNMLELMGWERVARHPFSANRNEGTNAKGADWLVRTPNGKLVLMELKWWSNKDSAEHRTESQVADDFGNHRDYKGEVVVGAHVAIVDWDASDTPMKVYLKWVQREASLK